MAPHDSQPAAAGASLFARAVEAANAGNGRTGDAAAVLAGAPLVLAFAPFGFFPLAPLGFAVLLMLWTGCSARRAALRGFAFGASGFLCGTYWLYISLHKFGGAPAFVAVPLMLGLVTLMASYFALAGWLVVRLFPRSGPIRWLAGAPGLWVLVEWLRSWVATGFPWFAFGYSQTDTVLVGFAPVLGLFGVSLTVVLAGGALLALAAGGKASRIAGLVVLVGLLGSGFALDRLEWSTPLDGPLDVAVVQGGISQDKKWKADQLPKTKRLYRELTDQHWDADLVVWPEAAIPDLLHNYRDYLSDLFVKAQQTDTRVLLGTLRSRGRRPARRYYNSVIGFSGDELEEYSKRHLVPFGEYYPVPAFVRRWMKDLNLPYTDISAGPPANEPLALGDLLVGVSICYEDVFGSEQLGVVPAAAMLVNVSNDAWFGGSVAPHQHLQIARMRAIEVARPMVRATNSGISAVIGHRGELEQVTGLFDAVVMRAMVQPRAGATPYARFGDWPALAVALALTVAALVVARGRGRSSPVA